jgi:hypothetical protein
VVTPGEQPRVHGYDIESDVALHYSFAENVLLTLTGELPSTAQAIAFDVALHFLGPLSVAHAPTHAAVLARICGARFSSVSAIAALTLAERARSVLASNAKLFDWLGAPKGSPGPESPRELRAADHHERAGVERLRAALAFRGVSVPVLATEHDLGRIPAALATLHFAGLHDAEQMEAALVFASFASAIAEARTRAVASFREYPMNVPRFVYEEGDE